MNRELCPEVCGVGCVLVYHRGAPHVCTIIIVGRSKSQLDTNFSGYKTLVVPSGSQSQHSNSKSACGSSFLSLWVESTHHPVCFRSVYYGWIVLEGILIINYHHYMIYLFLKLV